MDIDRLDLNLLRVFQALLRQGRVSAAAQTLGMSQPAVSSALGRLRLALDDELFLRTQRGMVPTPYAMELAEPVGLALEGLQLALNVRGVFDPARSQRQFTLAMTDVGEMYFLPVLVDGLTREAPGVTLQVVGVAEGDMKQDMASGRIDLALGLLPQLQAGFYQQALFRQAYVCLMRHDHPLAARPRLSVKTYGQAAHVRVLAHGTGHGRVEAALAREGLRRDVRLTLPHHVALAPVLRHTDLLATVPERFAQSVMVPWGLTMRPLPVKVAGSAIHQFWHARAHRDPGHRWLRQWVARHFSDGAKLAQEAAA